MTNRPKKPPRKGITYTYFFHPTVVITDEQPALVHPAPTPKTTGRSWPSDQLEKGRS